MNIFLLASHKLAEKAYYALVIIPLAKIKKLYSNYAKILEEFHKAIFLFSFLTEFKPETIFPLQTDNCLRRIYR